MIANILIIAFIAFWIFVSARVMLKEQREAKKTGIPAGCCGCQSYKKGMCPGHNQGKKTACSTK